MLGREAVQVDSSAPNLQVCDLVHLGRIRQVFVNKGSRNIQCLEKVVLVPEKGGQDVFEPSDSRVMSHVFWNIAVVRSHERNFLLSGILNEMKTRAIRNGNVNGRGLEFLNPLLYRVAKRESHVIRVVWMVGIVQKGNRDRVVEENYGSVGVFAVHVSL